MHVHVLKSAIIKQTQDAPPLSFTRKFEVEGRAIVLRVQQLEKLPNLWGLMFGDAVYSLRCALDHLAWELAVRHFNGVEPTDRKIIREIQFPVVMREADWNGNANRKHMSADDAEKLKGFQPFCSSISGSLINPIGLTLGFGGFSNVDKHRRMHLACTGDVPGLPSMQVRITGDSKLAYFMFMRAFRSLPLLPRQHSMHSSMSSIFYDFKSLQVLLN